MATTRERAAVIGYLIFATCVATVGFWMVNTAPTETPSQRNGTSEGTNSDSQGEYEYHCYDGIPGTYAECWERIKVESSREAAAWAATAFPTRQSTPPAWPSRPTPIPVMPALTLPPAGGTVCGDGSLSHSTGRGTCSWHGGIAR